MKPSIRASVTRPYRRVLRAARRGAASAEAAKRNLVFGSEEPGADDTERTRGSSPSTTLSPGCLGCLDVRLPRPAPYGVVEITPEREYMIIMEFFDGAVEIGDAEVDDGVIEQGLSLIRSLWDAGLAHRDIKPANLMVRDGRLLLIDVFFVQIRPSPWRQAVDLANMMLVLALRSDPERVYEHALRHFTEDEIAEAFAAARGVASPTQLRSALKRDTRDVVGEFRRRVPRRDPVAIQRWSVRRLALAMTVLAVASLAVLVAIVNWGWSCDQGRAADRRRAPRRDCGTRAGVQGERLSADVLLRRAAPEPAPSGGAGRPVRDDHRVHRASHVRVELRRIRDPIGARPFLAGLRSRRSRRRRRQGDGRVPGAGWARLADAP